MLGFIKNAYLGFVLVGFWIILIGFTVGGGILGYALDSDYTVGGGIIGLITGFVIDILVCGFIVTILNIDENIENMKRQNSQLKDLLKGSFSSEAHIEKTCKKCGKTSRGFNSCPHCGSNDF